MALCRLNNFCTDSSGATLTAAEPPLFLDLAVGSPEESVLPLAVTEDNPMSPDGLLGGGEHFDDVSRELRQLYDRSTARSVDVLPQHLLLNSAVNQGLKRPKPRGW